MFKRALATILLIAAIGTAPTPAAAQWWFPQPIGQFGWENKKADASIILSIYRLDDAKQASDLVESAWPIYVEYRMSEYGFYGVQYENEDASCTIRYATNCNIYTMVHFDNRQQPDANAILFMASGEEYIYELMLVGNMSERNQIQKYFTELLKTGGYTLPPRGYIQVYP